MKQKPLIIMIAALILGLVFGIGGTMGAQKFIFKTPAQSTAVASQSKAPGVLLPIGDFTVNLQGGAFLKTTITVEVTDAKSEALLKVDGCILERSGK